MSSKRERADRQPAAASPVAPAIPITLDRERQLKLDFNALALLEEVTGKNVLAASTWNDMGIRDVRAFLWAGLVHEDPALTLEDVGRMIHIGNTNLIMNALNRAWTSAMPELQAKEGPGGPLPVASPSASTG